LRSNLRSDSYSGDASAHYQNKREQMETLKRQEPNRNVSRFLDEYIEILDKEIEHSRISEERSD
jgi:hypothetical protein